METATPAHTEGLLLREYRQQFEEELNRGKLELPLLPQAASQVLSLANDPNSDLSDLAALIQRDQALASHVLRAANSAAFNGGEPICSLQQAITRLGMKFVADIAFAISVRGEVFTVPGFSQEAVQIWQHALASAAFGREIARLKRVNIEGQYLCGLLHTVGKPVALTKLARMRDHFQWPLSNAEILQLAAACHPQLGARLATAWNLPRQVATVCQWYPAPEAAPEFVDEVAMTFLSHQLARWATEDAGSAEEIAEHPVVEMLSIYPDELATLTEKMPQVLASVRELHL
jgi:HD-like signal output (HDOD) protein